MLSAVKIYACKISIGLIGLALLGSCNRHKPKPESKDYTKVKVIDSGHKDSVIDNKQRLYNASLPEPCLKCVVTAVRKTEQLKKLVSSADSSKIIYEIDWASGPKLKDSLKKAGSGLLVHVFRKTPREKTVLAVFAFDNVKGQLYLINNQKANQQELVPLDSLNRLKIRNACFWGVASNK
jgi:hypothetical protein